MPNDITLIALLAFLTLLPFLVASGTCYVKFSIVFVMVRNALGLQQVPSNMTLNGVALLLSLFVMMPIAQQAYTHYQSHDVRFDSVASVVSFTETGLDGYRAYLTKYADPELTKFFDDAEKKRHGTEQVSDPDAPPSILSLLPAYTLTEIKNAFKIGFYLYLPFVIVDLVISSILLSLGMMMMSPVTISVPVKLVLFVVLDGWTLLSKGLMLPYMS
ncbi:MULTISPECIES: EscR/YscR/HrcR family type III secretion system export apparatus protein [unclassified Undibacterium]|uniref:EscR/YscR/HrcR family type III secretion system export apparatus protein n=1 Tax=unclassified Undibacterium TaxID=2630295 RepID=UPI002AC9469D|nr:MULTISPECIES: EscR/YscR/HrcR family type III secretion system export apparatus protein [unclassified Undibacterium]MEB0140388.1 EscR/YscR/HrcR family type III secretion system export apparatus protein [Undibacterium sp. CCC2.1]MEB0173422.1 EscR/YscR/HrcR family type III secretion system export apparatus protein [Undibacterium sp. CCC1.1]MEB0177322.1 EscR/YscR/HrcR family type III secretion system export apparatus protein [Undibacterium sp. CCC3.4]MEB0216579.1 EscR/YscR/HrcR family type III s